jgi:magnesium transporter
LTQNAQWRFFISKKRSILGKTKPSIMLTLIEYNEQKESYQTAPYKELRAQILAPGGELVQWIDITLEGIDTLEDVSKHFKLHPLTVEDVEDTYDLPKLEAFEEYIFLTIKMLSISKADKLEVEHLSFILGKSYLLTFQQRPGDVFDEIRDRIKNNKGYVRKRQSDYLFTRLIDAIVDHYGYTLEHIREHINQLEISILSGEESSESIVKEILSVKKELQFIRSYMIPLRDALTRLKNDSGKHLHKSSIAYLTDIQDHLLYQITSFETFREMLKDLLDLHNTQMNNDMNKVMKTLTVISALFIPLTFFTGMYGMNFTHMPELEWPWAYPTLLGIMAVVTVIQIIYMKWKRWF